jgi:hypothetical protein
MSSLFCSLIFESKAGENSTPEDSKKLSLAVQNCHGCFLFAADVPCLHHVSSEAGQDPAPSLTLDLSRDVMSPIPGSISRYYRS